MKRQRVHKPYVAKNGFAVDVSGGDGYRKLRPAESEELRERLDEFSEETTKISQGEISFKKDLVKWLVKQFKHELRGYIFCTYNTGSAYERLQAGEAKDFDVMIFLNIGKWLWKVHDDPEKPGYCWLKRGKSRPTDNERSFSHLLDAEGRLSSLKVRKFFTSKIDRFLRKNNPLQFEYAPKTSETDEDGEPPLKEKYKVEVTRKYQGPATTLNVECRGISPFTIDLVNSLHQYHIRCRGERCDYVAKPYDKQKTFGTEYEHLWRKSYSRMESHKLKDIDGGNKIHKKLLRIFKILRVCQPQLKLLKTYALKNLLLYMSDRGGEWSEENIADRFLEMVIGLRNCLSNQKLPVYFNQQINLLCEREYEKEQLIHVMGYLKRIANKGIEGYRLLLKEPEPVKRKHAAPGETEAEDMEPVSEKKAKTDAAGEKSVVGDEETLPENDQSVSGEPNMAADVKVKSDAPTKGRSKRSNKGSGKASKSKRDRFPKKNPKQSDKVKENGKFVREKSKPKTNGTANKSANSQNASKSVRGGAKGPNTRSKPNQKNRRSMNKAAEVDSIPVMPLSWEDMGSLWGNQLERNSDIRERLRSLEHVDFSWLLNSVSLTDDE